MTTSKVFTCARAVRAFAKEKCGNIATKRVIVQAWGTTRHHHYCNEHLPSNEEINHQYFDAGIIKVEEIKQ